MHLGVAGGVEYVRGEERREQPQGHSGLARCAVGSIDGLQPQGLVVA